MEFGEGAQAGGAVGALGRRPRGGGSGAGPSVLPRCPPPRSSTPPQGQPWGHPARVSSLPHACMTSTTPPGRPGQWAALLLTDAPLSLRFFPHPSPVVPPRWRSRARQSPCGWPTTRGTRSATWTCLKTTSRATRRAPWPCTWRSCPTSKALPTLSLATMEDSSGFPHSLSLKCLPQAFILLSFVPLGTESRALELHSPPFLFETRPLNC